MREIKLEKRVDLVPVVRCKDCKYRDEQSANCTRFRKDWYVQSNSFCSWAERKDDDKSCDKCKHYDKGWDDAICDGCTTADSRWERKDDE